jgi:hypothetical protein
VADQTLLAFYLKKLIREERENKVAVNNELQREESFLESL